MSNEDDGTQHRDLMARVDKAIEVTERVQAELTVISTMTIRQEAMITKQAEMQERQAELIGKMWDDIRPVVSAAQRREELKKDIFQKILSGGVWGVVVGVCLLLWEGLKFYTGVGE
jgi:predicted transcriptional regulator